MTTIFLSFDDKYITEWYKWRDWFVDNDWRVTFYITNLEQFTPREWDMLAALRGDGHTIGCHGYSHEKVYPFVKKYGWCNYVDRELEPFFFALKARGFDRPNHFSYPNGNGNDNTDFYLLKFFKTVRYGGRDYIDIAKIEKKQKFYALNFGKEPKAEFCGHEEAVIHAIDNNFGLCLLMHRPIKHRLEWLAKIGRNIEFRGMGG
jgi:peptidoglycan/xylan/chitin deacetylase (PgdA/CDA1 family)